MIRTCPKCGDYYADASLAFCLADGTPLIDVDPLSESWREGSRVVEEKAKGLRRRQRWLKWRRFALSAMTMLVVACVVCVVVIEVVTLPASPTPTPTPTSTRTPTPTRTPTRTPTPAACSEADQQREKESIVGEFGETWRRSIEDERPGVIAEHAPARAQNPEARLGVVEYTATFSQGCAAGDIVLRYVWEVSVNVNGTVEVVPVPKEKRFACVKTEGAWRCG